MTGANLTNRIFGVFSIFILLCLIGRVEAVLALELPIGSDAYFGQSESFIPHVSDGSEYLAMNLPPDPGQKILKFLNDERRANGLPELKSRGRESHITIVTPPEFAVLKPYISMEKINDLALEMGLQRDNVNLECLGRGQKNEDFTYFLVVKRNENAVIWKLRQAIQSQLPKEKQDLFDPNHFYPHVTVGFTQGDLHEKDGVIKDRRACLPEYIFSKLPSP